MLDDSERFHETPGVTEDEAWQRLGELLIAARSSQGFANRSAFARHLGLKHQRTLTDIENAKRRDFGKATIASIEHWYGWKTGSVRDVLTGGDPTPLAKATVPGDSGSVGPKPQDGEEIVFRLPPGLTPRQRERARRIARRSLDGYLEDLETEED